MRIIYIRAAVPHEICQTEQVLDVGARLPLAHDNLGCDFLDAGWAKVNGVVRCCYVDQGLDWRVVLTVWEELHKLSEVAPSHRLPHIQVLKGLLNLGAGHLKRDTPGARLCKKKKKKD